MPVVCRAFDHVAILDITAPSSRPASPWYSIGLHLDKFIAEKPGAADDVAGVLADAHVLVDLQVDLHLLRVGNRMRDRS